MQLVLGPTHAVVAFTAEPVRAANRAAQVTRALAPRNAKPTVHRPQPRGRAARRAGVVAAAAPPAAEVTVREEKLEGSATRLHITVPAPMCQAAYKKIMADLRKGTTVDGFRKGKAPDAALLAHVGGQGRVVASALAELLEPALAAAMRPYEGVAVPDSERIEQEAEELEAAFSLDAGLSFSVVFDAVPELRWKLPYRDLAVSVEAASDESGDAAAAEEQLRQLRKGKAELRVVADRGLQPGDLAIVDFSAKRADDGEELPYAARTSMRLDTDDADSTFLPGIVAILEGMRPGEEKETAMTFPTDETFQPATLRGAEVVARVKMVELFAFELPELTDEWAASVMPGSDVAGLRQQLLAAKRSEREAQQRERVADAFMAAVGQAVDCDIPDSLLAELGAQQYSVTLNRLLSEGQLNYETVQQLATPEMAQQYVSSRREELLQLQRALLGMEDIARREGLQPSETEIEAEFRTATSDFAKYGQEYDAERLREQVYETLQADKVMAWLIENCQVTTVVPPAAA